ncbi:MAG: bifunctional salicylyl-CoA 5-hydroxylase/oxidoreductase [Nannocystaceae bacterium]
MKINCIGGGPGGLYTALLLKRRQPLAEVHVYERNRADSTFGFGVVFSDATLGSLARADPESYGAIQARFTHWDDIHIHHKGERFVSSGHGFCGFSRQTLLDILQNRCRQLGVQLHFEHDVQAIEDLGSADLVVAADGIHSATRQRYDGEFRPHIDQRRNRFIWLGTTLNLSAFTFWFQEDTAGLWRVHAYQYEQDHATFIVECTEETFQRSGLGVQDEAAAVAYLENLFSNQLRGHRLAGNHSHWRQFPTITCERWHHRNIVLIGDAVHTAHFSIGSGTKLAMEDAIALADAIDRHRGATIATALQAYEASHRADVDSIQRAAAVSLEWFEHVERYYHRFDGLRFAFSLLTRSLRVSHANLAMRDAAFVESVDRWVAHEAEAQSRQPMPASSKPPPPMFTPFRLRELVLPNRVVVSPMCQYSCVDGAVDDWHVVHLGSRAVGGAGLVMTEMTSVSAEGRISPGCAGLYSGTHVDAWRRVTNFVRQHTAAKIGVQIGHAGRKASTRVGWEGHNLPLLRDNWPIVAPSPLPYASGNQTPREMTRSDMDQVIADFVQATQLAQDADFDLLELHLAHGYLLSTFLSPLTNRRKDTYGGGLDNRARFPLELFGAVRSAWPADKPISVRISACDWHEGGLSPQDAVGLAKLLAAAGCDIVDVSTGQVVADQQPKYGRLYQTPFSELIRLEAEIPTITVGNISTHEDVNSVLAAGRADLCALARAMLYNPYWTRHCAQRQGCPPRWPPPYEGLEHYAPRDP